jgi:hypothetical protein
MPGYYLYFFAPNGHITSRLDLDCATDDEAIAEAENHPDNGAKELWERGTVVHKIPAKRLEA